MHSDRFVTTGRSKSRAAGQPSRRTVSLETTPPRRSRRPQAPPSLVQELDWVFTQRPRAGGLQLQNDALNRESDARRRRLHFTRMNLARAFARSAGTPLHAFVASNRHHHCGRPNRGTPLSQLHKARCRSSNSLRHPCDPATRRRHTAPPHLLPARRTTAPPPDRAETASTGDAALARAASSRAAAPLLRAPATAAAARPHGPVRRPQPPSPRRTSLAPSARPPGASTTPPRAASPPRGLLPRPGHASACLAPRRALRAGPAHQPTRAADGSCHQPSTVRAQPPPMAADPPVGVTDPAMGAANTAAKPAAVAAGLRQPSPSPLGCARRGTPGAAAKLDVPATDAAIAGHTEVQARREARARPPAGQAESLAPAAFKPGKVQIQRPHTRIRPSPTRIRPSPTRI